MNEKVIGKITYIIFHNQESGFLVASFKTSSDYGTFTITGIMFDVDMHLDYELEGDFIEHFKYGHQFKFTSYCKIIVSTEESIIAYLSGSDFSGIGRKTAEKIVGIFKENTLEVLKEDVSILLQYGFKEKQVNAIKLGLVKTNDISNDLIRLKELGVNDRILKNARLKFKEAYLDILLDDIYYAARHVKGLSCKIADYYIAHTEKNYDEHSKKAALFYEKLRNYFFQSGDTYISIYEIDEQSRDLIPLLIQEKLIVVMDEKLYLTPLYESETYIATYIQNFLAPSRKMDISDEIRKQEILFNIQYDEIQKTAIEKFFSENFLIISGGPGTGKTTITRAMIEIYKKKYPMHAIAICAPTGRASKRISELVKIEAMTIHRLLKWDIEQDCFKMNEENPIDAKLLIIDECSMMDTFLFSSLLKACMYVDKIVLIGDKDQLPSVAPGKILQDLLAVKEIERVILDKNHRQFEDSGIIYLAQDVNHLQPFQSYSHVYFYDFSIEHFFTILAKKFDEGYKDFQVLSSMYRGIGGIDYLNELLQSKLNPPDSKKSELKIGHKIFRKFDKVLQLKNQVEENVYNGDIGIISEIDVFEKLIYVNFDGNVVMYDRENFENITLGYCISVHKSQGSEYPLLFLFLPNSHHYMMEKELVYTAVTRAKNDLFIFGNKQFIEQRIRQPKKVIRKTSLAYFITCALEEIK